MARGVEAPTFPQFIQVGKEKMPFLGKNISTPIQGSLSIMILAALLEFTVSEWMLIPFDILVFAFRACSKERLSNSFYKSSSLCCRRANIQLLHIYILVPALGGAWKVEQPLEALPSSLHSVHWCYMFILPFSLQKNKQIK